jgi:seryl-tRNA synthetase
MNDQIEAIVTQMTTVFESAFATLIQRRDSQYAGEIVPLDAERQSLLKEHAAIGEAAKNLSLLLPARARQAQREADALLLDGKPEEAAAKIRESEEAKNAPARMNERQQEILTRIEGIEEQKKDLARRIFREWYPECQAVIRAGERGLFITLLDGLLESFRRFETTAKTPLVTQGHIVELTSPERSREWASGRSWYSGRVE